MVDTISLPHLQTGPLQLPWKSSTVTGASKAASAVPGELFTSY